MNILDTHWIQSLANSINLIDTIKISGIISWGLIILVIVIKTVYTIFVKSRDRDTKHLSPQLNKGKDYSPSQEINIDISYERFQDFLRTRDEELQRDMERMATNEKVYVVLENERQVLQAKGKNLRQAYNEFKGKLVQVHQGLADFQGDFTSYLVKQAKQALETGEPGAAVAFLKLALDKGTEKRAEASYLLGALAESRIDYIGAAQDYANAVKARPDNLTYLIAAAQFAYFVGNYAESEQYLKKAFQIQEGLLHSEHPEVALTLNNLAATFVARKRYDEAAAFYQWALEIYEKTLGLEHPRVVAAIKDYTSVLREMGRKEEALALEGRIKGSSGLTP